MNLAGTSVLQLDRIPRSLHKETLSEVGGRGGIATPISFPMLIKGSLSLPKGGVDRSGQTTAAAHMERIEPQGYFDAIRQAAVAITPWTTKARTPRPFATGARPDQPRRGGKDLI